MDRAKRMENVAAKYEQLQQQPGADKKEIDKEYRSEKLAKQLCRIVRQSY